MTDPNRNPFGRTCRRMLPLLLMPYAMARYAFDAHREQRRRTATRSPSGGDRG